MQIKLITKSQPRLRQQQAFERDLLRKVDYTQNNYHNNCGGPISTKFIDQFIPILIGIGSAFIDKSLSEF